MDLFNKPFMIVNQSGACNVNDLETCNVESEPCEASYLLSRQVTSGKRRLSNRAIDDNYGGLKQRQKLGNAVTYNLELEKNFNFSETFFDTYTARLKNEQVSKELDRNYAVSHSIDPSVKATMSWTVPSFGDGQWHQSGVKKIFSTPSMVADSGIQKLSCLAVTNCSTSAENQDLDICNHLALGVENMDIQSAETVQRLSSHVCSTVSDLKLCEMNSSFPDYVAQCSPASEQVFLPPDFRNFTSQSSLPSASLASAVVETLPFENQMENRHQWATSGRGARAVRRLRKSTGKSSVRVEPSHVLSNHTLPLSNQPEHGSDLEVIFSEMGVDQDPFLPSVSFAASDQLRLTTSLNVVETVSSIGTPLGSQSCASTCSHKMDDSFLQSLDIEDQPIAFMSARERNARIIKWLYSIRRPAVVNEDGIVVD